MFIGEFSVHFVYSILFEHLYSHFEISLFGKVFCNVLNYLYVCDIILEKGETGIKSNLIGTKNPYEIGIKLV